MSVRNRCQKCGSKDKLNLHHRNYKCLGKETNDDIIVLCQFHHHRFHSLKKWKNKLNDSLDFTFAKDFDNEYYHLSNVYRDCNRCGGKHPVHYKIFKNGKKVLAITCPKSNPRTEWLKYEDNLNIPVLNSKKRDKVLKEEAKVTLMGWSH